MKPCSTRAIAAAVLVGLAGTAHAQSTASAPSPFAFSAAAATDYRSKGISKSADQGAVFVTADWKSSNGLFYAGVAAATVDMPIGAETETDIKAGVRPKLAGWDLDFAVFHRDFHGANPGADDDYVEYRAQASRAFGPWSVRVLTWRTPDNVGPPGEADWSEARVGYRLARKVRLAAAYGHHDQDDGPTYDAWNAGVSFDLARKTELDLRWYDTDSHQTGPRYEGELVATLTARF